MPSRARPPLATWTLAIPAAQAAGWRVAGLVTPVPSSSVAGLLGRQRESDERVAGEVLRVDDGHPVPPGRLGARRHPRRVVGMGDARGPQLGHRVVPSLDRPPADRTTPRPVPNRQ